MTYNSAYTGPQIDKAARLASIIFDDLPSMLADARDYTAHTAGDVFWTAAEGFRYRVAASDASDHHLTTAGGVKLYVQPSDEGIYNFKAFNPAADGVTDDHPVLAKALAADPAKGQMGPAIYFPDATYKMNSPVEIKRTVQLLGSGSGRREHRSATLHFAADTSGITINRADTIDGGLEDPATTYADATEIRGLMITSAGGTDATKHGIWLRAQAIIENCAVRYFPGNGLHIVAAMNDPTPDRKGNANLFRVSKCFFGNNKRNGVYVDGPDTNAGLFDTVDVVANGRWGFWEDSFLGNTYIACHAESNGWAGVAGNGPNKSCYVSYGGNLYQAYYTATEADLVATTPGTDETVWRLYGEGEPSIRAPLWQAAQPEGTYHVGGNFFVTGAVNYSLLLGCYSEHPPTMVIDAPAAVIGGHMIEYQKGGGIAASGGNALGLKSVSVGTSAADPTSLIVGPGAANEVLALTDKADFAINASRVWRYKVVSGRQYWQYTNSGDTVPYYLIAANAGDKFGTGAAVSGAIVLNRAWIGNLSNARRHTTLTAAPTSGAWARGDVVYNRDPVAGGYAGWICVTAGTPGTWKRFGAIEA